MDTVFKSLPIELPNIKSREAVEELLDNKKKELESYHNNIRMFVWCMDPQKIKPQDIGGAQWIETNLEYLIGKQNMIGQTEIEIYNLETWLDNWDKTTVVKGFTESEPKTPRKRTTRKKKPTK